MISPVRSDLEKIYEKTFGSFLVLSDVNVSTNFFIKILLGLSDKRRHSLPQPRARSPIAPGRHKRLRKSGGNSGYPERCPVKSSAAIFETFRYDKNLLSY